MLPNRYVALFVFALFGSACTGQGVTPNLRNVPFPVLLGPVERIGSSAHHGLGGEPICVVEGTVNNSTAITTESYGTYQTTRTQHSRSDNVGSNLRSAARGHLGRFTKVKRLQATAIGHVSVAAFQVEMITVSSEIWKRDLSHGSGLAQVSSGTGDSPGSRGPKPAENLPKCDLPGGS